MGHSGSFRKEPIRWELPQEVIGGRRAPVKSVAMVSTWRTRISYGRAAACRNNSFWVHGKASWSGDRESSYSIVLAAEPSWLPDCITAHAALKLVVSSWFFLILTIATGIFRGRWYEHIVSCSWSVVTTERGRLSNLSVKIESRTAVRKGWKGLCRL